jgi:hypothetical protein
MLSVAYCKGCLSSRVRCCVYMFLVLFTYNIIISFEFLYMFFLLECDVVIEFFCLECVVYFLTCERLFLCCSCSWFQCGPQVVVFRAPPN